MSDAEAASRTSLRGDFAINLLGNLGYAAAQWAMLLVLVRLGSPTMVGEYSLGLAIGAPVIMFTNLRLGYIMASDAASRRTFGDYFSLRLSANAVALCVIIAWATAAGYRGATWWVILLVGLAKIAEAFSDVAFGYLNRRMRFRAIAVSIGVRGWGTVILMAAMRMAGLPLVAVLSAVAVWWWAAFLLMDLRLARAERRRDGHGIDAPDGIIALLRGFRIDAELLQLAWHALPLGVVALCLSLSTSIPRLTISRAMGDEAVGYFSALSYVVVAGRMVASALGTSTLPRLGRYVASNDQSGFVRTVRHAVMFGAALGLVGVALAVLAGPAALTLIYGADYATRAPVLTWLLVASGLGYVSTFLEDALVAVRRLHAQGTLLALTLVVITTGSLWLIPRYGLLGAAWALLVGAVVELIGAAVLYWRAMTAWDAMHEADTQANARRTSVRTAPIA